MKLLLIAIYILIYLIGFGEQMPDWLFIIGLIASLFTFIFGSLKDGE